MCTNISVPPTFSEQKMLVPARKKKPENIGQKANTQKTLGGKHPQDSEPMISVFDTISCDLESIIMEKLDVQGLLSLFMTNLHFSGKTSYSLFEKHNKMTQATQKLLGLSNKQACILQEHRTISEQKSMAKYKFVLEMKGSQRCNGNDDKHTWSSEMRMRVTHDRTMLMTSVSNSEIALEFFSKCRKVSLRLLVQDRIRKKTAIIINQDIYNGRMVSNLFDVVQVSIHCTADGKNGVSICFDNFDISHNFSFLLESSYLRWI